MPALPKRKDDDAKKAAIEAKKAELAAKKAKLEEEKAAKKKAAEDAKLAAKKGGSTSAADAAKPKPRASPLKTVAKEEPEEEEEDEESSEEEDEPAPAKPAPARPAALATPAKPAAEEVEDSDDDDSDEEEEEPAAATGKGPEPAATPVAAASASSSAAPAPLPPLPVAAPVPAEDESDEDVDHDDDDDDADEPEPAPPPPKKPEKPKGPAFEGAGKAPGVMVWRIEALHPTPIEKDFYGKFYSGDSYIILHTKQEKSGAFSFDLYFWLGEESSTDEQGTAAILAAQLDDMLGGAPVQHRIAQGFEPPAFATVMGGTLEYMEGGCSSGFNHVVPDVIPTRLLHVKGLKDARIEQVKCSSSKLNSGDVFILDVGKTVYQWNGKESSHKERGKGMEVCIGIKNERVHQVEQLGQEVEIVQVAEAEGGEDEDRFWAELGGDRTKVAKAKADTEKDDLKALASTSLWHLEELASGEMKFTEVKKRPLERDMLDQNDSFILACPAEVFVWIGAKASSTERKGSMVYAQKFLKGEDGKKRPKWTPVTRVTMGSEPTSFTSKFKVWEPVNKIKNMAEVVGVLLGKGVASGKNIAKKIEQPPASEIAAGMTISKADMKKRVEALKKPPEKLRTSADGKVDMWQIGCFKKHRVPVEMHGEFFAGDCYIVMFTYKDDYNKTAITIYFWLGRLCSSDEKGSAALLTRELDEQMQAEMRTDPVQVRVVQNNEPDDFLALFGGKLVVRDGGLSKNGEDTRDHDGIGLFQVKAFDEDTVRTVQVVESATSLNSADCFVLQTPGLLHVWLGSYASDVEKRTGEMVGQAMASRLKYTVENTDAKELAALAADQAVEKAAKEAAAVDEDGDGVPDVAKSLMLMVDADGDGVSDGLHADKLGLFVPQPELVNDRPYYANDANENLVMWWSGGKWWLGKGDELGRNRGWLKVENRDVVPPKEGWVVYVKKEKKWELMEGMVAVVAQRIAFTGKTTDEKLNDKLAGEFVRCAEPHENRPVYTREGRGQLMLWWNAGRWWLGKRNERGTNRGWMKAISDAETPFAEGVTWTFYSANDKKWVCSDSVKCTLVEDKPEEKMLPEPAKLPAPAAPPPVPAKQPASWDVKSCKEGEEPTEFWEAVGGKQPYESGKPAASAESFEPRFFECSDSTGAFRVEEAFDVCQEDLEHEDVYLIDCWSEVYLWVGKNCREKERTMGLETAEEYVKRQALLDGRPPCGLKPIVIEDGQEPTAFTAHFVGWSKQQVDTFEDPYEKRRKMLDQQEREKVQEAAAESIPASTHMDLLKELIKKTQERANQGGGAPPVAAIGNGDMVVPQASARTPSIPKLSLGNVAQASSLDSARRRANAAMAADSSLSGSADGKKYLDPQSSHFTLDEIKLGAEGKAADINPLCKELYLLDAEFTKLFGMDKDAFWKQPHWKQREAKRKSGLF